MSWRKIPFYTLWLIVFLWAVWVVKSSSYPALNVLIRVSALTAFPLLAWQIFVGAFMSGLTARLGGWVAKYHFQQGMVIGLLILVHPLAKLWERYQALQKPDPLYIFSDICVLCSDKHELYLSAGRLAFWLILAGMIAAKIRHWEWWKQNWRYFHWLNYFALLTVLFHAGKIGTDFSSPFYSPLVLLSGAFLTASLIKRIATLKGLI